MSAAHIKENIYKYEFASLLSTPTTHSSFLHPQNLSSHIHKVYIYQDIWYISIIKFIKWCHSVIKVHNRYQHNNHSIIICEYKYDRIKKKFRTYLILFSYFFHQYNEKYTNGIFDWCCQRNICKFEPVFFYIFSSRDITDSISIYVIINKLYIHVLIYKIFLLKSNLETLMFFNIFFYSE